MMYSRRYLLQLLSLHYLPGPFELREGWLTADLYEVVGHSFVPLNPRLVISLFAGGARLREKDFFCSVHLLNVNIEMSRSSYGFQKYCFPWCV